MKSQSFCLQSLLLVIYFFVTNHPKTQQLHAMNICYFKSFLWVRNPGAAQIHDSGLRSLMGLWSRSCQGPSLFEDTNGTGSLLSGDLSHKSGNHLVPAVGRRPNFLTMWTSQQDCLSVLTTWQLASPSESGLRESKWKLQLSFMTQPHAVISSIFY